MQLPPAIGAYFDADQRNDAAAIAVAFAEGASVRDEGAEHTGSEAIRDWWQAAKAK